MAAMALARAAAKMKHGGVLRASSSLGTALPRSPGAPRILITGFGPFPSMPFNASGALIAELAETAPGLYARAGIASVVLPVDWRAAPERSRAAIGDVQPDAVLHFGVSSRARGFVIETLAFNAAKPALDSLGRLPPRFRLKPGATPALAVTLPADRLAWRLRREGLPCALSRDAGRYLCNAILYDTLMAAARGRPAFLAGFIHIPALPPPSVGDRHASAPDCGWPQLRKGLGIIVETMIELIEDKLRRAAMRRPVLR
jgi:pyroglutamyl-peptidase